MFVAPVTISRRKWLFIAFSTLGHLATIVCLSEELFMINSIDDERILNTRSKLVSNCCHQNNYGEDGCFASSSRVSSILYKVSELFHVPGIN